MTDPHVAARIAAARALEAASRRAEPGVQPDEPAPPVEREYEVVGQLHTVGGRKKGETVLLTLNEGAERALIEGGHIRRVEKNRPTAAARKKG